MPGLDRTQMFRALTYLVMALFLLGGVVSARYGRALRWMAIAAYAAAMTAALALVALWLAGVEM